MKKFYKVYVLLIGLAAAPAVQAQTTFTLQHCIDYALENSVQVQNARVDEEIARARVKETRGIGLPQIDGSVAIQHNQKLQRFFGLYDPDSEFSFFPPNIPDAQAGDVLAAQNFFQLKSAGNAGLNINQILFNGSYLVGLKAASSFKDLSVKASGQSKEEVVLQVSKAYYLTIINAERTKLFDANIARVDSLLRSTKALYDNGFAEKIDVDRVRVTFNNLTTERDKFINLQAVALELLKFQMGYPMNQNLTLTGNLEEFSIPAAEAESLDYSKRWDYQVLEANKKLQQLDLKNQYAAGIPSLVAFANLGYATQSNNISGIFKTNSAVESTEQLGPDKWYGFSSFGVSLNVPIFSGLQRSYRVQQSKLNLAKIENLSRQLQSAIDVDAKNASTSFANAIKTLTAQQENMDLASNVARVTKIKYEQGVGSNLEVIDAEAALREAQTNYYNALYEVLISKVDLDKAYGKLVPIIENENK
jgi:outer membrane protein